MSKEKKHRRPEEVDIEGLTELISSLPDEVLLAIMADLGISDGEPVDEGEREGMADRGLA